MAKPVLENTLKPKGFQFDDTYHPVALKGRGPNLQQRSAAIGFNYNLLNKPQKESLFVVRAFFDDQDAINNLINEQPEEVVGVYADPTMSTFSQTYCDPAGNPVGDWKDVERELGIGSLNLTGKGVRIAIVDTGINGTTDIGGRGPIGVADGWSPSNVRYRPGTAELDHGTMCAFDARVCAPDAEILDYALMRRSSLSDAQPHIWNSFLSDAIAAFADLIDVLQTEPGPLVVNNSWGLYNRAEDEPIGSPGSYSANPDHPFNQIVGSLVAAGADVLFAAGNCGRDCPDDRCGQLDIGPGNSIHGANSHPDVITVAAITTDHRRLGYSSQGPGGLDELKPDVSAYSHFKGSGVYLADSGTSAASPVAAGVIAALREKFSNSAVPPATLKAIIQRTADNISGKGWDHDLGYGIINAQGALKQLP